MNERDTRWREREVLVDDAASEALGGETERAAAEPIRRCKEGIGARRIGIVMAIKFNLS